MYKFTLKYAWKQDLPNQIVTTIILLLLYPLTPKKYKKHYFMFFAIPAYIGSLFPDVAFFILYMIYRTSNVYNISHSPSLGLILVPLSQAIVYIFNKILTKEKNMPEYWYLAVGFVSLVFSWLHLVVDKLGF